MAPPASVAGEVPPLRVTAESLAVGDLVAEGGEGRVFEVRWARAAGTAGPGPNRDDPSGAELVYKQLRQPRPVAELSPTVAFLPALEEVEPALALRVRSSCAWPLAVVVGEDADLALGTLMPRAPRAFWLRHRAGGPRLASLSYLAGDPDRITVAYGTVVPSPGAASRVAVVYALARLLEAWQGWAARSLATSRQEEPGGHGGQARGRGGAAAGLAETACLATAVHGDLSAKNVLWSLDPVPAVYVLDCDGALVAPVTSAAEPRAGEPRAGEPRAGGPGAGGPGADGPGTAERGAQRATTPNWDDPALTPGSGPTAYSDRYTLGLAFLRVVGAAHFPIQARQRAGEKVSVDLELPRSWRRLPDMPRLWALCERSLSQSDPSSRAGPGEWAAELEELLEVMGAGTVAGRVREAQGDPRPSRLGGGGGEVAGDISDVTLHVVIRHRSASTWRLVDASGAGPSDPGEGFAGLGLAAGLGPRAMLSRCGRAWASAHGLALRLLRSPGRRTDGFRRLVRVLLLDLAAACIVLFLVGEIVSPWIGL